MLNAAEIDKLCYGRLIYAPLYNSSGTDAASEPHWAIILDDDDAVREEDVYHVVVISHDTQDDFRIPVPPRTGRTGFIQGTGTERAHLAGILDIGARLVGEEMKAVLKLVDDAREARNAKRRKGRSTRS